MDENVNEIQADIDKYISDELGIKTEDVKPQIPVAEPEPKTPEPTLQNNEPPKVEPEKPEEKEWWQQPEDIKPVETDWKSKWEEDNKKLSKYEQNKLLKTLSEVADAPDFDFEKFIDSQRTKRIDFTAVPLADLYKASLDEDKIANYTEAEIEQAWDLKKAELEGNTLAEKALRSELINKFQSKQPAENNEDPEIVKNWKIQKAENEERSSKTAKEYKEVNDEITSFTDSLAGKKMGEIEITKDEIERAKSRSNIDYYRTKDGKLDGRAIAIDRMKAVMFDKLFSEGKKAAKIEAIKEISRPSNTPGTGGAITDTDGRDADTRILDEVAQKMGLKDHTEFK